VEGPPGSVEKRSELNRKPRKEAENRRERNFTLYSDGRQPERASGTTDEPPDWNTQGPKLYGSVERATRRKAQPRTRGVQAEAARRRPERQEFKVQLRCEIELREIRSRIAAG